MADVLIITDGPSIPDPRDARIAQLEEENRRLTHRLACQVLNLRRLDGQWQEEIRLRSQAQLGRAHAERELVRLRDAAAPFARLAHWLIGVAPRYGLGRISVRARRWFTDDQLQELARVVPLQTIIREDRR